LTLLVGWQEGHPACKKTEWWGAGTVICLERDADLHMAQLMPLALTVSCFSKISKIQIGFTFPVPPYAGSPGQRAVITCTSLKQPHIWQKTTVAVRDFKVATTQSEKNVFVSNQY